ncbi:hypothetical protein A3D77_04855 [Candidatus Gottesmanbacteria bacterium RIFCSPHIGHO2_02_FULL_39_11]|uniref:Uncharacterized protein n=1 Tax=Candidatus Gottesmanbacteria bacterium RIFCSPHIGHO2_02_FULL_39_11 TaxID=1798382 RepID=A0A1F5ZLP0_9BACT|nr:MAG: hypothetical protein A3D77_04855 [Candidatus Gottesmanbacteria bacterium RIFCSPHIGHO2_02_FULL_39_11]
MLTKKKIVILSVALFALAVSLVGLFLTSSKTSEITSSETGPSATSIYRTNENRNITSTPIFPTISLVGATFIPTVTPIVQIPTASPSVFISTTLTPTSTLTPTPGEITLGRLSYIQDKDIYNTDLKSTNLLVANETTPSGSLKWSPKGSYLSWISERQASTSSVVVYHVEQRRKKTVEIGVQNFTDYAWSPDEKKVSILYGDTVGSFSKVFFTDEPTIFMELTIPIYPISGFKWLKNGQYLIWGSKGIYVFNIETEQLDMLVSQDGITFISISPDETKLLYSVSENENNEWYIKDLTGNTSASLIKPQSFDFTSVNLPASYAEKGFDSKAVWFPSSDKIFLTIKYLREFPIVGMYDISSNSYSVISFFNIKNSDFMSDPYTLIGERAASKNGSMESQIHLFTIEGQANLGLIKVIPHASSPAFYFGN